MDKELIEEFNKLFSGQAKIIMFNDRMEITVNHTTLEISLPKVIGAYSS